MENKQVQFDEPEYRMPPQKIQRNLFINFLIDRGWAKDKQQASYILLGGIGICILIMIWVFGGGNEREIDSRYNPETGELLPGEI